MKPFDDTDTIPEEMESQHQELLALLPHMYHSPAALTAAEQEQIIGRARERLLDTDASRGREVIEEVAPVQSSEMPGTTLSGQALPPKPTRKRRRTRLLRLVNALAAVLVVGAIIGASLLLFSHRPQSHPGQLISNPPNSAGVGPLITVRTQIGNGLEMSMSLTPGPYFYSEMLGVVLSLTNHTATTFYVGIPFGIDACGYTSGVVMTGGASPDYVLPLTDHSCPPLANGIVLKPGQTLTTHKYMVLTRKGDVTLTAKTYFQSTIFDVKGNPISVATPISLNGHWPSLRVQVSSVIPANRQIQLSVKSKGGPVHGVIIIAPPAARGHLVYLYDFRCGNDFTGNFNWDTLSTTTVNVPGCSGVEWTWNFAFAAPGYAVASGGQAQIP
jgi:hypothetical protein